MTHYGVLVIVKGQKRTKDIINTVKTMMEPYDENTEVPEYPRITRKQAKENRARKIAEYKDILSRKDKKYRLDKVGESLKKLKEMTDNEYWKEETKYDKKFNKKGEPLTTYNPKSKWDYFSIYEQDGWFLSKKEKKRVPIITADDIDWEAMETADRKEDEERWDNVLKEGNVDLCQIVLNASTKEEYMKRREKFHTCAVVTPDGVWHEPSRAGWWGMSLDRTESEEDWAKNFHKRFIKTLKPKDILVCVDCHI